MVRSTEQVFQDQVNAHLRGDFDAMVANYADDAVLLAMDGARVGKAAIEKYLIETLSALHDAKLTPTGHIVQGDYVLFTWTGESDTMTIPYGVDTFVIHDGKIQLETVWLTMIPK
ncbi:MAG: nuclear transport factor 2 family protein [Anaerolineae bacterium]|nr:nuclear transport factor 2 family protein [Anaerolineae bacterium]